MFTLNINPCPDEPGFILICKHCGSRSAGFIRSQLIRIHSDFHSDSKLMLTTGMPHFNRIKIGKECSNKHIQHDSGEDCRTLEKILIF